MVECLLLVKQICADIYMNCGFLCTSMKVGMLIENNSKNYFRSGTTLDLTFGDL